MQLERGFPHGRITEESCSMLCAHTGRSRCYSALFGERITPRLWAGIVVMTASCALLAVEPGEGLTLSPGLLLVLGACLCWGVENNCMASIANCDPALVVAIKGIGSGIGALAVALLGDVSLPGLAPVLLAMLLGFASYGLSILANVRAQRGLGAARTSAYYAVGPFIGVAVAWLLFGDAPGAGFLAALALMALGSWLSLPSANEYETPACSQIQD